MVELEKLRADHAKIRAEIEDMMAGLNHEQVTIVINGEPEILAKYWSNIGSIKLRILF